MKSVLSSDRTDTKAMPDSFSPPWFFYPLLIIIILALFWHKIIFHNQIFFFFDLSGIYYPLFSVMSEALQNGHLPLWTNDLFAGTPPAADATMAAFYPINFLLFKFFSVLTAYKLLFPLHIFIAAFGIYFWLKKFTGSAAAAFIGTLIFSLSGYWTARALHLGIWMTGAWIPWGLWAMEKYLEEHKVRWVLFWGIFLALQILAGFVQLAFYFVWISLLYALLSGKRFWGVMTFKSAAGKIALWLSSLFLAVGTCMAQLMLGMEFTGLSVREEGIYGLLKYVGAFSPAHLLTFISPDLFGRVRPWDICSGRINWLEIFVNYWESAVYIGMPALFLIFLALRSYKQSRQVRLLTISAIVCFLIAFGMFNPVMLILQELPGWKYFRVYSRFNLFTVMMLAGLAGIGFANLTELVKSGGREWLKSVNKFALWLTIIWVFCVAAGNVIFRLLWHFIVKINFILIEDLNSHIDLIQKTFLPWNPLVYTPLLLIAASILAFHTLSLNKLKPAVGLAAIVILLIFDLFIHNYSLNPTISGDYLKNEPPLAAFLKQDITPHRIMTDIDRDALNLGQENYWAERIAFLPIPHNLIWGNLNILNSFGPLKLKRVDELNSLTSSSARETSPETKSMFQQFAGVKYIITDKDAVMEGWETAFIDSSSSDKIYVYENLSPQPNAFLTENYLVDSPENIKTSMLEGKYDLTKTVLLEKSPSAEYFPAPDSLGEVVEFFKDNRQVEMRLSCSRNAFLVLTDTYYPGWKAYIDGRETEIYPADYVFRAVEAPAGEHTIRFEYEPDSFKKGLSISIICGIIMIAAIIVLGRKKV